MESTLESFLVSVPQAATIWMIMLLAVALAVAAMALPRRRAAGPAEAPAAPPPDDDTRFADEVAVAAERAAATAHRRREEWRRAAAAVDAAWQAYEAADRSARRTAAACAFPTVRRRRDGRDHADRERYLHRAATAACRRGELSIGQLNEALAHRCGWDPELEPPVQEARLRRAVLDRRLAEYRAASARERAAWSTAELASAALVSLRAEACVARIRAGGRPASAGAGWWSEQWATTEPLPAAA